MAPPSPEVLLTWQWLIHDYRLGPSSSRLLLKIGRFDAAAGRFFPHEPLLGARHDVGHSLQSLGVVVLIARSIRVHFLDLIQDLGQVVA